VGSVGVRWLANVIDFTSAQHDSFLGSSRPRCAGRCLVRRHREDCERAPQRCAREARGSRKTRADPCRRRGEVHRRQGSRLCRLGHFGRGRRLTVLGHSDECRQVVMRRFAKRRRAAPLWRRNPERLNRSLFRQEAVAVLQRHATRRTTEPLHECVNWVP